MSDSTGIARKVMGGLSVLITAFVALLLLRAVSLWTTTADLFYITSAGFYAIVTAIVLAGIAWGFQSGGSAEKLYMGGIAVLVVFSMIGAAYYLITAFAFGNNSTAGAAGISLLLTGFVLLGFQKGIPYVIQKSQR